ncbi:glycosyl hydrolase family 71-domain-containing protein [Aspergillus pseudodeflectus]|uniref:Glycosyl hydrolase family 71-domain-containing protein n=1 Tax=Aspergillus pseudodeflectus TaxID=176178 RepID=A0ABR4L2T2_9EURO
MHLKSLLLALVAGTGAFPTKDHKKVARANETSRDRLVFCHFMIGISSNRQSSADYDDDMIRAKELGIDAFALNIGVDPYTDTQLQYAYKSAADNDMKVFISFDFNWYHVDQAAAVGQKIAQYAGESAQLIVDGKVFVSSFAGDGIDVAKIESSAGTDIFWAPNYHPGQGNFDDVDSALNWMAWDNDGNNKAPKPQANVTVAGGDQAYIDALGDKPYLAPASGWFFTHFGGEVPYSKNWVFPGDLLWYNRWREILELGPRFVEIVTWNDYGESHYIGPLSSPHTDDGASKWVMDMPHGGWLEMSRPFIAAYKAGETSPDQHIGDEKLIYWYRPTPRDVECDSTDTTMGGSPDNSTGNFFRGRPDGWETMQDEVFVVSLLTSPGTIQVTSGSVEQSFEAPAGASAFAVEMGVGQQKFSLVRDGRTVMSETSLKDIAEECICGLYNFNAYVGVVPAEETIDQLDSIGLAMLTQGLNAPCPTNTLGASASRATTA